MDKVAKSYNYVKEILFKTSKLQQNLMIMKNKILSILSLSAQVVFTHAFKEVLDIQVHLIYT